MPHDELGQLIYVTIGNSDNKLTQKEWQEYCRDFEEVIRLHAMKVWGIWFSLPNSQFQNMCIGAEIHPVNEAFLQNELVALTVQFKQDSIAWMSGKVEFIRPVVNAESTSGDK